ncbi:hypothetical protein BB559_006308 [Furculomyces boomerangus]|uniref:Uncharacterized protein n=2 Tax=Harpellales TaxID=61421 RepID=A0A2T9Y3K0_9FUNG|nr:hypothetical protein BB559_006308 [Furculomyces boomerangus]PVZ98069.1 hypothetical protein BB558_005936 [Smittium angustum]
MSDSENWSDQDYSDIEAAAMNPDQDIDQFDDDDSEEYDSEMEREAELERSALESIKRERQLKKEEKGTFEKAAIAALIKEIKPVELEWIHTCSVTSTKPLTIENPDDDIQLELAIYQQALEAAKIGKKLITDLNIPFTRPSDYFAEMVKTDEDMEKIRLRLLKEHKGIEKSEEAKRQRELKKFGKKVQTEKLQERMTNKRETLGKIEMLKRKRKGMENSMVTDDGEFDIAIADNNKKSFNRDDKRTPNSKRLAKNKRYGSGGAKRGNKRNTAESTSDISGFNGRGKSSGNSRGKKPRLGKNRRMNAK